MARTPPPVQDLEARVRDLEAEIARLRERIGALENRLTQVPEHPVDQQMVRSKVAFDWQT